MQSPQAVPQPEAIRSQLDRMLESAVFAGSPRLCRLLRYLVEQKIAGKESDIKEYSVGLEVFDRPSSFDPKTDSIVRATARKLRSKLQEYYQNQGSGDPVVIEIPKGGYSPRISARQSAPGTSLFRRLWPAVACAALLLSAWSALGWRSRLPDLHPSVAVLDVANIEHNQAAAWVSTALAEMITENLSANDGLRAVPAAEVAEVRRDGTYRDAQALQQRLGAGYVALLDFRANGGVLQVNTRLRRVRDGQILLRAADTGSEAQLYGLTAGIARRIRVALRIPPNEELRSPNGPDRDSMRLYSEAVVKLRESDPLAARTLLQRSAAADPSNFLARSVLAETYLELGMEAQAKIEAQAALALAPPLPPIERLALEARCQSAMRDWPAAAHSYQKLWNLSPEVVDYGIQLADVQRWSGEINDAMHTVSEIRKQPLSPSDEVRVDFTEAMLRYLRGESRKALALTRQSEAGARRLGARYLYARARLREGGLLMELVEEPLPALDEGLAICREQGYLNCELNALRQEGNYFAASDGPRALNLYRQGVALARQLGNRRGLVELVRGMAVVDAHQLRDQEAEEQYGELTELIRDESINEKLGSEIDLPELFVAEGRFNDAARLLDDLRGIHNPAWELCMAELERSRGQLASAAQRAEAVVEEARQSEARYPLVLALLESLQIHLDQGNAARAQADVQQIESLHAWENVAALVRAQMAMWRANWDEAAAQAENARRLCKGDIASSTSAALIQAEALANGGHAQEALRVLDEITPRLDGSRRAPWKLRAHLCRLRAEATLGSCANAPQLRSLSTTAENLGMPSLVREIEGVAKVIRLKCGTGVYAVR